MTGALRIAEVAPGDAAREAFDALRAPSPVPPRADPIPPGARLWMAWRDGTPLARLSTMLVDGLQGAPGRTGMVGHYEAVDGDAGAALLLHARSVLAEGGAARVLGPMDGSTWARYRLVLPPEEGDARGEPPFLGEPWNPAEYPAHFAAAGFRPVARYWSGLADDLGAADPRADAIARRLRAEGVAVRPLALADPEDDLRAAYGLSLRAFAGNPFYSPVSWEAFAAAYRPLLPLLDPGMVRLARDADGRLLGFVLAYPDPLGPAAGDRPARVVLKTLATAPEARGRGLGTLLTDQVRHVARERGHTAVIHALMHEANDSARISRHSARVLRRYALFGWEAGAGHPEADQTI